MKNKSNKKISPDHNIQILKDIKKISKDKFNKMAKILDKKKYRENWDKIFGKKTQKQSRGVSKIGTRG